MVEGIEQAEGHLCGGADKEFRERLQMHNFNKKRYVNIRKRLEGDKRQIETFGVI